MSVKEKIGIYIRVSTLKQVSSGGSIDFQLKDGKKYCKDNCYDYKIYNEGNISGKEYNREVWMKFEEDILNDKIDGVYFWDFDRMFRDLDVEYFFKKLVDKKKFKIISGYRLFDLDNDSDYGEWRFRSMGGDIERRKIVKRTKRGRLYYWERGKGYSGRIGFGYKRKNKEIIIDKRESEIVKDIYKTFLRKDVKTYMNCYQRIVNKWGVEDGYDINGNVGKKIVGCQSIFQIKKILNDEKYLGVYKMYSKEFDRVFEFDFGRIIEDDVFNKVKEKIKLNIVNRRGNSVYKYLLKGKIKCGYCEGTMWIDSGGKRDDNVTKYYRCNNMNGVIGKRILDYNKRNKDKNGNYEQIFSERVVRKSDCVSNKFMSNRINIGKLEELVWRNLFVILKNSKEIKEEYRKRELKDLGEKDYNKGRLKFYENKLDRLEKKYLELLNKDGLDIDDFNLWKNKVYKVEKLEIEGKIKGYKVEMDKIKNVDVIEDYLSLMEKDLNKRYNNINFSVRRGIIEKYVKRILVKRLNNNNNYKIYFDLFLNVDSIDLDEENNDIKIDIQKKLLEIVM